MTSVGPILDDAAKDMAKGGEKAGKAIAEHFEGIGSELEHSATRYRGAEETGEQGFKSIVGGGAKDAEQAAGSIGKDAGTSVERAGSSAESAGVSDAEKLASDEQVEDAHVPGSQGASRDPVDLVSGEMFLSQRDVALDGVLPLILERMHRSGYRRGRLFGRTWSSTLDQRIEVDADGVHYAAADGTVLHYPVPTQPGQQVMPSEGARWPLSFDRREDTYRIAKPEAGLTVHFAPGPAPDAFRPLSAVTDRNGNRITVTCNADAVPTGIYHSGGYHVEVSSLLTRDGLRVSELALADPDGGRSTLVLRFGYDIAGRLTEVVNSSSAAMVFEYDEADRIIAWMDRNGYRYEYYYDPQSGRVARAVGADGFLSASFDYDLPGRVTTLVDSLGRRSRYRYNERGHMVEVVDPLGGSVRTEQDAHSRLLARTDQLGRVTKIGWSPQGDPVRVEYPDGSVTTAEYDEQRRPLQVTTPTGGSWQYAYDECGNLISAMDPLGAVTRYTYDECGGLGSVTDPDGNVETYANDRRGLPMSITDQRGATTQVMRDAFGRAVAVRDPLGRTRTSEWTVEGRPARRAMPDGSSESYLYDGEGNLLEHRDAAGFSTRFEYGAFDRIAARIDPDGTRYEFEYDTELNLTKVIGPTGLAWHYTYDACGNVTGEIDFNGRAITYVLDAVGQMVRRECAGGAAVVFEHDLRGSVTRRSVGEAEYRYAFDSAGLLLRAEGPDGAIEYTRDRRGRILTESFGTAVLTNEYDVLGRRTRRTTPSGAVSAWQFDQVGQVSALATASGGLSFQRDEAGQETSRVLGERAALSQAYDVLGRLSAQAVWVRDQGPDGGEYRSIQSRTFAYRADGHPLEVADQLNGSARYRLDELGRVTAVDAAAWREEYAYDALGNLAAASTSARPGYDAEGPHERQGTLVRRAGRVSFGHDERGRVVTQTRRTLSGQVRRWAYVWDSEDRLRQVTDPDGATWNYTYDPLGRRFAKTKTSAAGTIESQVTYAWDGPRLAEQSATGPDGIVTVLSWDYEPGSYRPAAQTRRTWADTATQEQIDEAFYAIVTDRVGVPRELVTPDGEITWRLNLSLWGLRMQAEDSRVQCPLRFPGQYHDEETGWHYNYHRYYDPESASYASPDPLGLAPGLNHYAYVGNPLTGSDPLGLAPADCPSWGDQDPVTQAARQEADNLAPIRPDKDRPAISEAIQTQNGTIYTAASTRGAAPVLRAEVQQVLDGVPQELRGVGHGKCGLPVALSDAIRAGEDPTGSSAAAVIVRNNVNHVKHGVGVGPCPSCQALRDHFDIHFTTGGD
jgi:RHS repeat-associated protein